MLATLERPLGETMRRAPILKRVRSTPIPPRLTVLGPPPGESVPVLAPVLPVVSDGLARQHRLSVVPARARQEKAEGAQPTSLRMTVRARRLLAGLAMLCAVGLGVIAVDVVAALVPHSPDASYAAQFAPYGASSPEGGADAPVPASGSSIVIAAGDTLWSVAQRVDPGADPRTVIAAIMTINDLDSPTIQAGQVLRLP